MSADAPLPDPASAIATGDPLPSAAAFASDGTERLAPIGSRWNALELRDAYFGVAALAARLHYTHPEFDGLVAILKRLWAADYAFRPDGPDGAS
jgi:hypothetical protein